MGRKKGRGGPRPTKTFTDLVGKSNQEQLKPYINQQVQAMGAQLAAQQRDTLEMILTRLTVMEKFVMEKLNITEDQIANRTADVQDELYGLTKVEDEVKVGDRVRCSISVQVAGADEFGAPAKQMIDNVGSGSTYGKEVEDEIIGIKLGESKEFSFGEAKENKANITIDRISRKVVKEENNVNKNGKQ